MYLHLVAWIAFYHGFMYSNQNLSNTVSNMKFMLSSKILNFWEKQIRYFYLLYFNNLRIVAKPPKATQKRTKAPKDVMSSAVAEPQLLAFQSSSPRAPPPLPRSPSQESLSNSQSTQGSTESGTSSCVPNYILRPGQFEIVLCVDNAEFYGSRYYSQVNSCLCGYSCLLLTKYWPCL